MARFEGEPEHIEAQHEKNLTLQRIVDAMAVKDTVISVDVMGLAEATGEGGEVNEESRSEEASGSEERPEKAVLSEVTRETIGLMTGEVYAKDVWMWERIAEWSKELPGLPRKFYATLAEIAPSECSAEEKEHLQGIRRGILSKKKTREEVLRKVWGEGYANASRRLREAFSSPLAVPPLPSDGTPGRFNSGRLLNGHFALAPGAVVAPIEAAAIPGSALPPARSWGRKVEPQRQLNMFKTYVGMGEKRTYEKVAKVFRVSARRIDQIAQEWCWGERMAILQSEQALIANITRTDDVADALRATGIGIARSLMGKIETDPKTGMITGIKGFELDTKYAIEQAVRLANSIRTWLDGGGEPGERGRGPGGLKTRGSVRPIINFVIKK